ncbi:glutamate 5-kinase [Prochlorococcus sp. MIT 1223]|uniref:glutamate 5-kinase n=1 Tax=Prochlorococcus sp. MIT 1223 TaxID=3096217 RepID=UPI002A74CCB9|nr:glutamate 5-kinase [Prochlorococcus sp. MIT 1223]
MSLLVIKIGTSLLRGSKRQSTAQVIDNYCECIAKYLKEGNKVIIVSSGSVGLGCDRLEIKDRPEEIVALQAVAAVGQGHLMSLYEKSMNKYGYKVAQILLTRSELGSRLSYVNASMTLQKLLDWNVIPIVNENDTIAIDELKYGDNDTLSALVAGAISADKLILLTDIDKLYSSDPKTNKEAHPINEIYHPSELKDIQDKSFKVGTWGTGGIKTKLAAAKIATERGITVHLADGREPSTLKELFKGLKLGTIFHPQPNPIGNKKSWLAYALKPAGSIQIDNGACYAIKKQGASLLLVGIKNVNGSFTKNQAVTIESQAGEEIGRGICSLSSEDIRSNIRNKLSSTKSPIVIHRDVLVLTTGMFE